MLNLFMQMIDGSTLHNHFVRFFFHPLKIWRCALEKCLTYTLSSWKDSLRLIFTKKSGRFCFHGKISKMRFVLPLRGYSKFMSYIRYITSSSNPQILGYKIVQQIYLTFNSNVKLFFYYLEYLIYYSKVIKVLQNAWDYKNNSTRLLMFLQMFDWNDLRVEMSTSIMTLNYHLQYFFGSFRKINLINWKGCADESIEISRPIWHENKNIW